MCRHSWPLWIAAVGASFGVLEARAFFRGCHPTLSRELRLWLRCESHPWAALIFVIAGAAMAHHLIKLKELPADERR